MGSPAHEAGIPARRRGLTTFLKLGVSLGLLAYLLTLVDVGEIGGVLVTADPALVLAGFLFYLGGQALSAVKWGMLARAVGFDERTSRLVGFYFIGMFFNVFGLGTVGGDVVRSLYLGRQGRRGVALNTVIADRASGLLVLLAVALVSLLAFRTYNLPAALYWTVLLLSAGLLAGWWMAPRLVPLVIPEGHRLRRLVEDDLAPYWRDRGLFVRVGGVSLVFHLSQIGIQMILAASLGLAIPWSYFFVFGPLVNLFSALPISLNGLGIREGGYVFFLTYIGIANEQAVAFALLWFGLVLASGLGGGIVYLRLRGSGEST